MSKPKGRIIPKAINISSKEVNTLTTNENSKDLEGIINDHIENKELHMNSDIRDNITYLRKDLDMHLKDTNIHVTLEEKTKWDAKETVSGAQSKVNKVLDTLELHKSDKTIHITKAEKDLLKDKYTKAETRNLLKHSLTGLKFLEALNTREELNIRYKNPEFNSCVYLRVPKITLIFNGEKWVEFDGIFTPDVTQTTDGYMTNLEKIKLDSIEEGANNYIHPDNVDVRHVSDSQIDYWNKKADNTIVDINIDGLMASSDKIKLDSIEEGANKYIHPDKHNASIIEEDELHRFVSDEEKSMWNNKAEISYVDESVNKTLTASKSFTDAKISAMFNSTEQQLQVLRSLAFELKKDDTVKQFFDLFNSCAKSEELSDHILNSKIHMSKSDIILLKDVKAALDTGLNTDWNENDPSSLRYIENKPTSLPANGGNADTVGGYTAQQLLSNKNFYDYTVGTSNYTNSQVSVLLESNTVSETIESIIDLINKGKGNSVLFRSGSYSIEKELVIKTSNTIFTGIGEASKLLGVSIRIIGNNNTFENITISNDKDNIVDKTAIYIEGNDNVIRFNKIINYDCGIIVEGSNNIIANNTLVNIRTDSIKLTSNNNMNYGNNIDENTIKNSNKGIILLSSKNALCRNHVTKNKIFTCNIGIILSNTINDKSKTMHNIISENMVIRGRGDKSEYLENQKTIISEFSSKNIISSNITSGKEIIAPNDVLVNNIY